MVLKTFMKILIFSPYYYSLKDSFVKGFIQNDCEVLASSYQDQNSKLTNYIDVKTAGIPYKLRRYWESNLFSKVQKKYLDLCNQFKPQLILIYNNEHFFPETLEELKKKSKIAFVLGDNPLMSKTDIYNLTILNYADYVICPDSYWKQQLENMGIKNIHFDLIGFELEDENENINSISKVSQKKVSFIGRTYGDSDGYKRALFLSKFVKYDLQIFTRYDIFWEKWLGFFPELRDKIVYLKNGLSSESVSKLYHESCFSPVDGNSGLINGIHLRFFDILQSGSLPIVEYKKDYETAFPGYEIPQIIDFDKATEIADYYVDNYKLRNEIIKELRLFIHTKYRPELVTKRIIEACF